MNILVCLKQTFDTEEKIIVRDGTINEEGVEFIINPYDEYAVEEAVRLKEAHGGEVTVVTLGKARSESALRTALAIGADQAILIEDECFNGDEYTVSQVLAAVAKRNAYDVILCGYMAIDEGSAQIGPRLAEELDIPHIIAVTKLQLDGDQVIVEKDVEGDTYTVVSKLPILVTAQQGLNEPRYPSLPNIIKAKRKPLERIPFSDLAIDAEVIQAKTESVSLYLPAKKQAGKILKGELSEQAKELAGLLRQEAKVL